MATKGERFKKKLDKAERTKRALELRAMSYEFGEIAEDLGISRTAAFNLVDGALKALPMEAAKELQRLEVLRLDKMLRGLADKANAGDLQAVDRAVRIQERRAALLGLDAERSVRVLVQREIDSVVDRLEGRLPTDVFKQVCEVLFGAETPAEVPQAAGSRGDKDSSGSDSDP